MDGAINGRQAQKKKSPLGRAMQGRKERFNTPPDLQISPPFVRDILARLSSYYARQGQPDIDFHNFIGS